MRCILEIKKGDLNQKTSLQHRFQRHILRPLLRSLHLTNNTPEIKEEGSQKKKRARHQLQVILRPILVHHLARPILTRFPQVLRTQVLPMQLHRTQALPMKLHRTQALRMQLHQAQVPQVVLLVGTLLLTHVTQSQADLPPPSTND